MKPADQARLARAYQAELTYTEVGATDREPLPAGYHHVRHRRRIGHGEATFERAREALLTWQMHRRTGQLVVGDPRAELGATVVLGIGLGPARLHAPCRVVRVVDERAGDRRAGFAYGTLPGHPETGEEAFILQLGADQAVSITITAFSRPGTALTRAAGPAARAVQRGWTRWYARALASLAAA